VASGLGCCILYVCYRSTFEIRCLSSCLSLVGYWLPSADGVILAQTAKFAIHRNNVLYTSRYIGVYQISEFWTDLVCLPYVIHIPDTCKTEPVSLMARGEIMLCAKVCWRVGRGGGFRSLSCCDVFRRRFLLLVQGFRQ
jgi:hypothetical protein